MHIIENDFLKVKIRSYGAELTSVFDKKNNLEHLWNADEKFWPWHAPVLFPVVGRSLNDEITVDGTIYPMEKHGFARKTDFKILEQSENKIVFAINADEESLELYPYQFEFLIAYRLTGNQLLVSYEVRNTDTKDIYFQLGSHPAFAVPFVSSHQPLSKGEGLKEETYEDYHIEFSQIENAQRHHIDSEGFFDGRKTLVLNNTNILPLDSNMFNDDAYIFKDLLSHQVTIRSKNHSHYLSVNFEGFNYLGLWAKVNAPYVCVEPWLGCADTAGKPGEYAAKEGIIKLLQDKKFNSYFTVTLG